MATNSPIDLATTVPGDRVFRWWESGAFGMEPQYLTVARVNPKTVTVRTKSGHEFRIKPHLLHPIAPEDDEPFRSRRHEWVPGAAQQSEYNSLVAKGRTRYDRLRTLLDWDHDRAYRLAAQLDGLKPLELRVVEHTVLGAGWVW